ncbi:unnamed protein product [Nippostrongylus brasiliensis]|uniref:Flagellar protein FliT n=1 Tax=Nippostrongylus brasiliensis TaxID=27835 RepID=A0A0N4XTJ2_NIPBR|nr:unnamed protein product [Nippostrongylus brasiliensis]
MNMGDSAHLTLQLAGKAGALELLNRVGSPAGLEEVVVQYANWRSDNARSDAIKRQQEVTHATAISRAASHPELNATVREM